MIIELAAGAVALVAILRRKRGEQGATTNPTTDPTPGPAGPVSDLASEAAACTAAVTLRPQTFQDRARPADMDEADWLARVALWSAYPSAPPDPAATDPVYGPALARLRSCVAGKLQQPAPNPNNGGGIVIGPAKKDEPAPAPVPKNDPPIKGGEVNPNPGLDIKPVPTPGSYYTIKAGDALLKVSNAAYNTPLGTQQNYQAAKRINDAPANARFRRYIQNEVGLWGQTGRITFLPKFGTIAQQLADPDKGSEGQGINYATIYIPPAA